MNCLDVHVETHPDRVALIWERDEPGTEVKVTYRYGPPPSSLTNKDSLRKETSGLIFMCFTFSDHKHEGM